MLSIIVPVFNAQNFLERCIDSLLVQTFEDFEIIIVDDCSTDNSLKIIKGFEKKTPQKIRVIESKIKLRQGGARNLGINLAKGDYIGFVDSDDWVHHDMFKFLYTIAKKENSDMVGCRYFLAYSEKKIKKVENHNSVKFLKLFSGKNLTIGQKKILFFITSGLWCHIYKKTLILENNIFFPEKLAYEDNYFVRLYILYIKKYSFINKSLYYYFKNPNSTTNQKNKSYQLDRLVIERKKLETYKERNLFFDYKEGIEIDFLKTFYINTLALVFTNFDDFPVTKLKILRKELLENFPEYKKNPYYKKFVSRKDKLKCKLSEICPTFLKFLYTVRRKLNEKN
ncbi:MAG: glycosyltransferase [Oscillospiraceae bacterium]|jgi:glycosyltransferase involved in cell wall biosynthesis|nr:glycosyltransferase [Oscillospiraceae bacterium]